MSQQRTPRHPLPPPPPGGNARRTSSSYSASSGGGSGGGSPSKGSSGRLPLPPGRTSSSSMPERMAQSMTIDEMRVLHQRALQEAEAKRTELRLVLASRYRELVGSSDKVLRMRDRAQELYNLVHALPELLEKLERTELSETAVNGHGEESKESPEESLAQQMSHLRRQLSELPRMAYRSLDRNQVHSAATTLIGLFTLIASQTKEYPMANLLANPEALAANSHQQSLLNSGSPDAPLLATQMRMIYLQVQTLPRKILRLARAKLSHPALDQERSARASAAALAALHLLGSADGKKESTTASALLETYFEAKAQLLMGLLQKLNVKEPEGAEAILAELLLLLQHDVIVHPYEIFVLRRVPGDDDGTVNDCLPLWDPAAVQARCSKFLAYHLPLIRNKVKTVLVSIAGTTASALGHIRQSLYDKTDGAECMRALNEDNPIASWDDAVGTMVDLRTVLGQGPADRKFSLWSALFSQTFSSLVHSLLTTAFYSVHSGVVATLRTSLANAPEVVLPHEAYRNTLRIATDLDHSLRKVSEDAYELLVHAEEREESEQRLRQSLYVQTCEILGRLVVEIRRIAADESLKNPNKDMIVARLCYLLKFRLTSLPKLLDPTTIPTATGMISYVDLESAFSLADDDDDGVIQLQEAMQATESAFAGTQFQGVEMVRETLLLAEDIDLASESVTLHELVLLTARGLRHEKGERSALGTVQAALDAIVDPCLDRWGCVATTVSEPLKDIVSTAVEVDDEEYKRLFTTEGNEDLPAVSPFMMGYLLKVVAVLNQTTTPSDALAPPLEISKGMMATPTAFLDRLRFALLRQSLTQMTTCWEEALGAVDLSSAGVTSLKQFLVDVTFLKYCYLKRNQYGLGPSTGTNSIEATETKLNSLVNQVDKSVSNKCSRAVLMTLPERMKKKHFHAVTVGELFLSSLFGQSPDMGVSAGGEVDVDTTAGPFFYSPLASSRRFALLPIQSDRSLSDLQLKTKYAKEKQETDRRQETSADSLMSSGLGFFSNMLKKK